jgi:hypothetical protein
VDVGKQCAVFCGCDGWWEEVDGMGVAGPLSCFYCLRVHTE